MKIKLIIYSPLIFSLIIKTSIAQNHENVNTWANFEQFKSANDKLSQLKNGEERIVFLGNSITIGWKETHPEFFENTIYVCLLYTSPSPRDLSTSRMPSSA